MADNSDAPDTPLGEQVGQKIHEGTEQVKQQAQQAVQQGQQMATRAWETGRSQFKAILNGKKGDFATRLEDMAKVFQTSGSQLREQGHAGSGEMAERLAERISQATGAVRDKEIEEIIADTEDFARAQPALFLSVVGLLGFVLARFLKSSQARAGRRRRPRKGKRNEMASNKNTDYQPPEPPNLFQRVLDANPLALGLVALAIGALIGLLLPETRKENELMGPKRDELLNQGRQKLEDLTHRAEAVAGTAKDAAQEALEKARGAAQEALGEATTAAREAVTEALANVKEEVKHQGEGLVPTP